MRRLLIFALACAPLLASCVVSRAAAPVSGPIELALSDVEGSPRRLSDWGGRVRVVFFFATWCPSCVAELPFMRRLDQRLGAQGGQVIGVSLDQMGAVAVAPFAEFHGLEFPVLVGDEGLMEGESGFGQIRAVPTTVLLDERGRELGRWVGDLGDDFLEQLEAAQAQASRARLASRGASR